MALIASVWALAIGATATMAQEPIEYTYDELGRLKTVCHTVSNKLVAYDYDPAGNRTDVEQSSGACGATSFSIADAGAVAEGGNLVYTVTRSGNTSDTNAVDYATANGTATAGSDYTAKSGTLTFSSGQTSKNVSVATLDDSVYEVNETVFVNLSSPTNGATIAAHQGVGTINNNDPAPTFAVSNASTTVGSQLTFTVTKTGATARSHAVNYATANNTAIAGTHYTAKSGTLSFSSGQTSKTVNVNTTSGSIISGSRNMRLNLSSATNGATISDSQGTGTINALENNPPNAVNDSVVGSFPTFSSVTVYVLSNDSDPDQDPLTVTGASCISSGCGVLVVGGDRLSISAFSPGGKSVTYWISDGNGGTDSATATVSSFVPDCGETFC